ncbi:GNAT family N-acetyltransferase [Deinococcus malanensis]|uniref:GNAT family N-acetyltransferase n=1 Tax=Deinococcus malanensis TaxID=1706855 RepID=UPI003630E320
MHRAGHTLRGSTGSRGWWELGLLIFDPSLWDGGVGTLALRRWTDLTFRDTDAHVLTLTTWSGNERMIRAGQRAGWRECARLPQGRRHDSVKLALLRQEWENRP